MSEPLKYSCVLMIPHYSLRPVKTIQSVCCNDYESFQIISGNVLQNQLRCCVDNVWAHCLYEILIF